MGIECVSNFTWDHIQCSFCVQSRMQFLRKSCYSFSCRVQCNNFVQRWHPFSPLIGIKITNFVKNHPSIIHTNLNFKPLINNRTLVSANQIALLALVAMSNFLMMSALNQAITISWIFIFNSSLKQQAMRGSTCRLLGNIILIPSQPVAVTP